MPYRNHPPSHKHQKKKHTTAYRQTPILNTRRRSQPNKLTINITRIVLERSEIIMGQNWEEKLKCKLNRTIGKYDSKLKIIIKAPFHNLHAQLLFYQKNQSDAKHSVQILTSTNVYLSVDIPANPNTPFL